MLHLKRIKKSYKAGDFAQIALNGIDLSFRRNEFVAILGPSGSGKTTCLNILGGLDRYDEGDLVISSKSTKEFRDRDWDAYRNKSVGFIFQNYNLIPHLSIVDNIEMGMTLSGLSAKSKRDKAINVLERVGLIEHINKRPTQLSGGQMQRVAIARALANEPEIILADEPTGALDTETSMQIMQLVKEIAQDKLVIMVTHNPEIAESYADRIIKFQDGNVIYDSHPYNEEEVEERLIRHENGKVVYDSEATQIFDNRATQEPDIVLTETPFNQLSTHSDEQIMNAVKDAIIYDGGRLTVRITKFPTLPVHPDDRMIHYYNGQIVVPLTFTDQQESVAASFQEEAFSEYKLTKTSMNYLTALKLSGKNIAMKKWRTFLTMSALSIGLIGVAIILALSNGFSREIAELEAGALMDLPISIFEDATDWDSAGMFFFITDDHDLEYRTDEALVHINRPEERDFSHRNILTEAFFEHLDLLNPDDISNITHSYMLNMNLLRNVDDEVKHVRLPTRNVTTGHMLLPMSSLPQPFRDEESLLYRTHDLLAGSYPEEATDLILVVDSFNRVNATVLEGLGFEIEDLDYLNFDDFVGLELRWIPNNDFYTLTEQGNFVINTNMESMYESENAITLTIRGVFRQSDLEEDALQYFISGVLHSDELTQMIIDIELESDIVQAQLEADYNVFTLAPQSEDEQRFQLNLLGGRREPAIINIFPNPTFESKNAIIDHIEAFNETIEDEQYLILYEDQASIMSEQLADIIGVITVILVAFSAISLVVSMVMIAIITYISVMERTKEIGILRALGARKRDITRIFIAEVIIIGLLAGVFSLVMTYLLSIPINFIISIALEMSETARIASLSLTHGLILVLISLGLTMTAGFIPARIAAKKDPVDALRSE